MIRYLLPPMAPPYPLVVRQAFGHPGPFPPHSPHTGLDLAADVGRVILAVGAGKVVHYFRDGMGDGPAADGNAICVQLDPSSVVGRPVRCWWLHLSHSVVVVGDIVAARQPLGATGATGEVTGPHLHFQVEELVNGVWTPVDPATRFLPLALLA